tara:strand:+ start:183 stop:434 length:252 start_codon:yes stop_codon:yes gene_type:complete
MDINPKQFAKSNSKSDSPFDSNREQFVKDDEDPLSIKDASLTFLGIILAFMTMFLPVISIFLDRPLLQKNGVMYNEMVKNDGY